MGLLSSLLGVLGFGIGLPLGFLIGFYIFIYSEPRDVKDPEIKLLCELDTASLEDLMPEIPLWVKSPDFDRVDCLNKFLSDTWPFLDKKLGGAHIYGVESIEFKNLSLGHLPPTIHAPNVPTEAILELLKDTSISAPHNKKQRGKIVLDELTYAPFREDLRSFSGILEGYGGKVSITDGASGNESPGGAGLLLLSVQGVHDVEGSRHNNPYVLIMFRGEKKKSKMIKRTRNPAWDEEFQFLLEEPPLEEKIKVMSKRSGISFHSKESFGHVDINLSDVIHNGRINQKYHLIDSKNGVIHVELCWKTI